MNKKTVVLGASPNPSRYSYVATRRLNMNDHEVIAIGNRAGNIDDTTIITDLPEVEDVDTVTLYLNPKRQEQYYNYILQSLQPKRIIFNPGTENPELMKMARAEGVEVVSACTLVMLSVGSY